MGSGSGEWGVGSGEGGVGRGEWGVGRGEGRLCIRLMHRPAVFYCAHARPS